MRAGAQIVVKPPIMIRIPVISEITIDAHKIVYLSQYPIGFVSPLCPDGFMVIDAPIIKITGGKNDMVVAKIENGED
ncbi:MAG: hypothetical protein Q8R70_04970 [Methanoregula sp.]|nr:hypothetical protein [Methanoregula sp.]